MFVHCAWACYGLRKPLGLCVRAVYGVFDVVYKIVSIFACKLDVVFLAEIINSVGDLRAGV